VSATFRDKKPPRLLSVFDTTLRDGEQAPGNSMSVEQKVELAKIIEDLGVNVIEAGFPSSSELDFQATSEICRILKRAKVCAFVRARRDDIDQALKAVRDASSFQLQTLAVGSDIHLQYKRKMSREQAIEEATGAVRYAQALGVRDISLGIEDASRGDIEYLKELSEAGVNAGATMLVIADTVGSCVPGEAFALLTKFRTWFGSHVRLSGHFHNDMGLAHANALAAVEAGADEIQVTLCGIGERAGNSAVEELATALHYKQSLYGATTSIQLSKLQPAAQRLQQLIRMQVPRHKAVVGTEVFATEAGIHQAGIIENPTTYEFLNPETFGRRRRLVLGRHSGRHVLRHIVRQASLPLNEQAIMAVYDSLIGGANNNESLSPAIVLQKYKHLIEIEKAGAHV
jgi:2-isopropylmalate synthase